MTMTNVPTRVCDACGTTKNVAGYLIEMNNTIERGECEIEWNLDLCPEHKKRAIKFIERGTTPTTPKKGKDDGNKENGEQKEKPQSSEDQDNQTQAETVNACQPCGAEA